MLFIVATIIVASQKCVEEVLGLLEIKITGLLQLEGEGWAPK